MKFAVLLALSLGIAAPALADPIIVPSETCKAYFFVPVTLPARDDRPDDRTLWFLYDTGASSTYVDPDSIERVSGMRLSSRQRARIDDASIGELSVSMSARVTELDHLSMALGREIDGILAFGAFDDFLLTLDYENAEMRLETGELPRPDNETVFSANGPDSRPWLRVRFEGRTRRMLIDSGAALGVLGVNDLHRYDLMEPARPVGASVRFSTIEYRDGGRLADPVFLGPHRIETPLVSEVPRTEIIGGEIMRHFTWTFDQDNERVRLVPVAPGDAMTTPSRPHPGLALRPVANGLEIQSILPGSAAVDVDLQPGDVLTHVFGVPMADRGCEMRELDAWTVTRLRDGQSADVTFPLVTLVE
tara:strand:- start:6804 stop:7886 length:1083 start_codon:yes stop_codon:yes gene_type:complete